MTKSTKNKVKVGIGIVALLLVVFIAISIWQGTANFPQWFQKQDQLTDDGGELNTGDTGDSGLLAPDEQSAQGISIKKMAIPVAQYDDYGVSAAAETALQLTVTVTPANADVSDGKFTVAFKNASSTWATGKTLSEYVTLSQTDTTHATVSCLKAFGEQIIVTYTVSGENGTISIDYSLDYAKRIVSSQFAVWGVTLKEGVGNASTNTLSYGTDSTVWNAGVFTHTYSDYTVDDTFTASNTMGEYSLLATETLKAASSHSYPETLAVSTIKSLTQSNFLDFLTGAGQGYYRTQQFRTECEANNQNGMFLFHAQFNGTHSSYVAEFYISINVSSLPIAAQNAQFQGGTNTVF